MSVFFCLGSSCKSDIPVASYFLLVGGANLLILTNAISPLFRYKLEVFQPVFKWSEVILKKYEWKIGYPRIEARGVFSGV